MAIINDCRCFHLKSFHKLSNKFSFSNKTSTVGRIAKTTFIFLFGNIRRVKVESSIYHEPSVCSSGEGTCWYGNRKTRQKSYATKNPNMFRAKFNFRCVGQISVDGAFTLRQIQTEPYLKVLLQRCELNKVSWQLFNTLTSWQTVKCIIYICPSNPNL